MVSIRSSLKVPAPSAVGVETLPESTQLGVILGTTEPLAVLVKIEVHSKSADMEGCEGALTVFRVNASHFRCSPSLTKRDFVASVERFANELSQKTGEQGLPLP